MWDNLSVPMLVVLAATGIAAWTDIRRYRIYNALTVPLALSGIAYHTLHNGWNGCVTSSFGFLIGLGLLIIPYAVGLLGAGDVKLLAGIGAWLGGPVVLAVFVGSALVAGVYGVCQILIRRRWQETLAMFQIVFMRFATLGAHLPKEDLVENATTAKNRRLRAIPFAAAVPFGVLGALWWLSQK